jgi:type I restriction enzyme R subunit
MIIYGQLGSQYSQTNIIVLLDEWRYPMDRDEVYKEIYELAENFKRNVA